MELIKYQKGTAPGDDGLHLSSVGNQGTETLCGFYSSRNDELPESVEGDKPECPNCIRLVQDLFKKYTKKQVESW